jgi:hypothetical protein
MIEDIAGFQETIELESRQAEQLSGLMAER